MLSHRYEPKHVAMNCLHPDPSIKIDEYQAYVKLHLSSMRRFQLNVSEY